MARQAKPPAPPPPSFTNPCTVSEVGQTVSVWSAFRRSKEYNDEPLEAIMRRNLGQLVPAIFSGIIFLSAPAQARITRIVIEQREAPAYKGQSFKNAGPYEKLT